MSRLLDASKEPNGVIPGKRKAFSIRYSILRIGEIETDAADDTALKWVAGTGRNKRSRWINAVLSLTPIDNRQCNLSYFNTILIKSID